VKKRGSGVAPLLYLVVALALAFAVLPSVLRPPPEQQQASSALNPNAPPEESPEQIIQSLQQAASRTAGATGDQQEPVAATTTSTVVLPSRGRCYGDPPRQTESAYSPPCRAAFTGDNGGSTYKNVTGNEVRIAFWHLLGMPAQRGPIADTPQPDEDAAYRTARVIQQYFNERYELYGRHLRLIATKEDPTTPEEERASAVASEQAGVFAAVHLFYDYCGELARRGLECMNGNPYPRDAYLQNEGRFWSYQAQTGYTDAMLGEYLCKKLVGRSAEFAGGQWQGQPRKIGILVESSPQMFFRKASSIDHQMQEQCGASAELTAEIAGNAPDQIASTMAQMLQRGVTTIVLEASLSPAAQVMATAEGSAYQPEWVMFNSYGLDFNDSARLLPRNQLAHLFGMSGWELPRPFADTDCYRAYKTIDPAGTPDANFCNLLYISIEHLVNGIQEAGPDLNPDTFEHGMFSMPLQQQRYPWSITGGYGPGDYSFVDSFAEMWWDPTGRDPNGNEVGCYRYTEDGSRYRLGELDGVVRTFHEGVRGYNAP
jgi:hypothetical protein